MKLRLAVVAIATLLFGTTAARAQNFAVGTCLPNLPHYQKIQDAVSGVTPGSTIFVCPNVYPEQVTINQPLTLQGVKFQDQDRPTITVPPGDPAAGGGLQTTVTTFVAPAVPQIIVQNVTPAGPVNILNLTIDGTGAAVDCSAWLLGIYYGSGTSGAIKGSALRHHQPGGCGFPIWVENGAGPSETIEVSNNSIHDYDGEEGIRIMDNSNPSTLSAEILSNSVYTQGDYSGGITVSGTSADIAHNLLTGSGTTKCCISIGIASYGNSVASTITDNDVTNWQTAITIEDASTAKSNRISNSVSGILLNTFRNPGPVLTSNAIKNTQTAIEFLCTPFTTVKSNIITDAVIAFDQVPLSRVVLNFVNQISDIDTVETPCPN